VATADLSAKRRSIGMQKPSDPSQGENTYMLDAESAAEMARLTNQDILITKIMGGLLPERPDFSNIHRVLDIACGPGGWALEIAFAHPDIEVVGVDSSRTMIEYARAQAQVQGLDNASFKVMDVLKPLDFPADSFDLVNVRLVGGFMSPMRWPTFVQECVQVARPGGLIRLTETDNMGRTNSPALEKLWEVGIQALQLTGRTFTPEERDFGTTLRLRKFLRDAGCQNIKMTPHVIDFSAGTEAHESMCRNWMIALKLGQPFLVKVGVTTQEEAERLYQQAMAEMMSNDFCSIWYLLTACGEKP